MTTKLSTLTTGIKVFQIGVILQSASYYVFYILLLMTWRSVRKEGIATGREKWWKAYKMVAISSLFIIVSFPTPIIIFMYVFLTAFT